MQRRFALCLLVAASLAAGGPVFAKAADSKMSVCAAQWQTMKKAGTAKGSYTDFSKTCLKGGTAAAAPAAATPAAPAPVAKTTAAAPVAPATPAKKPSALGGLLAKNAPAAAPAASKPAAKVNTAATSAAGATAQCKDGTFSQSKTHSGACSRHGGVAKWL